MDWNALGKLEEFLKTKNRKLKGKVSNKIKKECLTWFPYNNYTKKEEISKFVFLSKQITSMLAFKHGPNIESSFFFQHFYSVQ